MKKKLILILFISCAVLTMIFLPIKKEENYIKIINNNIDDFKYKIGNDYFTGTYHYITISDVVDAVSSLEYSEKIEKFDINQYNIPNQNYIIEFINITGHYNDITYRFYNDFEYVLIHYGRSYELSITRYTPDNVYKLKDSYGIKNLFLKSDSYIPESTYENLIAYCTDLLTQYNTLTLLEHNFDMDYSDITDNATLNKSRFFELENCKFKISIDDKNKYTVYISNLYDGSLSLYITVDYTIENISISKISAR